MSGRTRTVRDPERSPNDHRTLALPPRYCRTPLVFGPGKNSHGRNGQPHDQAACWTRSKPTMRLRFFWSAQYILVSLGFITSADFIQRRESDQLVGMRTVASDHQQLARKKNVAHRLLVLGDEQRFRLPFWRQLLVGGAKPVRALQHLFRPILLRPLGASKQFVFGRYCTLECLNQFRRVRARANLLKFTPSGQNAPFHVGLAHALTIQQSSQLQYFGLQLARAFRFGIHSFRRCFKPLANVFAFNFQLNTQPAISFGLLFQLAGVVKPGNYFRIDAFGSSRRCVTESRVQLLGETQRDARVAVFFFHAPNLHENRANP
ncbi:hypothetical protein DES41_102152 [Pseudorhodoferax soli]|uniref:Uncharacterized protein n=1 Tax=Pseudorhodoferax soli TaxID=545864 RepID=A0A368Y3F6_9BURK|nr:hypothetical protein DES41_102152 [Pseudorhodoferax soli]